MREQAETFYDELTAAGIEVLMDDRPLRPGVMFADVLSWLIRPTDP